MKRTLLSTLVITSTLGLSANVFALGMGELELKSTLNQPLQAEIELTNIDDLTEWEIKPSLASDGDFDRAGVEKIFFLSDIDFEVKGNRIVLSSDKSVTEPFLNFLVQVNWPSGRVLREYTLLLDPPVFDEQIQPLAAADASQRVETQVVAAAQPAAASRWESEAAAPGTYKVQANDTLWGIAINTRPNRQVSPQQMMLAIQDSNPGAFIGGNINRLKTHQVLRIPTQQQIAARNDSQAVNEVMRQNRELQSAGAQIDATANAAQTNKAEQLADGGELKLLSKTSQVSDSAGAGGDVESGVVGDGRQDALQNDLAIALETLDTRKLENEDLKTRLASLEEQIATLQRLVSLKDDQLASIQTLDLQKEAQQEDLPIDELAPTDITDETLVDETLVDEPPVGEDFNYADDAVEAAPEETEVNPALAATQIHQQTENRYKPKGFIAEVMAKPELMGGIAGGIALLLGLIGLGLKKRRAAKEGEIEDPELAGFDENFEFGDEDLDGSSLDDFDFDENDAELAAHDELNDNLLEGIGGIEADAEADAEAGDLDAEPTDTVAQTADIIGEAEIYIAYGRFDQAAGLLKNSIEQEPSRIDLRIKLLEVYLETDDASSFAEAELDLNAIGDLEANEKAAVMRNRLTAPISGVDETPTVDDLLAEEYDLSTDMETLADSNDEFANGIDFEAALNLTDSAESFGGEAGDELTDFASSLDALDADTGDNFDIEFSTEAEVPTLEEVSDFDLEEVPTLEDTSDFDLDEVPTLEEATDFDLSELAEAAGDGLTEAPVVDDSVVDLSLLAADDPAADHLHLESLLDADDAVSGLPDLDFDLVSTGFESDALGDDLQALEAELDDLTSAPKVEVPELEVEAAPIIDELAEEVADFEASLEFDLNELEDLPDFTTETAEADVALEDAAQAANQEIDLDQLAAADDEFDFLAGTDECATKLDLARAYLDMEDSEGAKELLQEVVTEGSDQQKQDARALMDSIG